MIIVVVFKWIGLFHILVANLRILAVIFNGPRSFPDGSISRTVSSNAVIDIGGRTVRTGTLLRNEFDDFAPRTKRPDANLLQVSVTQQLQRRQINFLPHKDRAVPRQTRSA